GEEQLEQPLRFQGQYFDAESGLHYNRHRYYNPDIGRYLTPDPIKLAGGLNGYQYTPNPTGWIDPLGLNGNCPPPNKPDCKAPDDVGGAAVDEQSPALPKTEKFEPENEAEAKRQVLDWEKQYKMHTVAKHGPEIGDKALKQRAIDGSHPTKKGVREKINSSSQFKSWTMQFRAISYALSKMHRDPPEPTGYDSERNPIVRMELPGAGRGYKPNDKDRNSPKYIEGLDGAEIKFDKRNIKRPFTAFPRKVK
ncbi:RHS repeat-associated core domain-containing protein, partial [Pseudomonas sp. efr-133-R2A-59]